MTVESSHNRVRLDRWLWAARFFKTRAQAKAAIEAGKVDCHANGQPDGPTSKPRVSKDVSLGDCLSIRRGWSVETVLVRGLSEQRGSATIAQALYEETAESVEQREAESAKRRMERAGLQVPDRRPSKHERRARQRLKQEQ